MKILFLTRLFYPHIGGIEKHIEKTCNVLIKDGYEITILTTKYDKSLPNKEIYKGVNIIRFTQPKIKYLGIVYTWFYLIKYFGLIKESDIVHIHDVFIWYWPYKILMPLKKVFITFHGRWGNYPIPKQDLIQKRIGAKFSNGVLSIGDYIPKYYGVNSDLISYGAVDLPKKHIRKGKLIIYVGRMDKDIALEKIFKVLEKMKNYKIVFCGDGELKGEAKKYGEVKGFVDTGEYYKKAKYVFASGYLTILEGLINRCLIFALYENTLQKDYYGLAPFSKFITVSDDPEKILVESIYLDEHPKEAEKITEKGYDWVKSQTWEKMADKYQLLWGNTTS